MSHKIITGEIYCARTNHNKIHIGVQCSESGAKFLSVELSAEQFGKLITGLSMSDIQMEVRDLDRVGKRSVRESREVLSPEGLPRTEQEQWIRDHCQEEGWTINASLNSQSSVKYVGGKTILNYSVFKFIDI